MKPPSILLTTLCGLTLSSAIAQTADPIYHNGSILTMAGKEPAYAEALAVKDGKILAIGAKGDVLKAKGDATKVVDLGGKALLPGFLDAHSHYINSLLVSRLLALGSPGGCRSQVITTVRRPSRGKSRASSLLRQSSSSA